MKPLNAFLVLIFSCQHILAQLPYPAKDKLGCYWGYKYNNEWVIQPQFLSAEKFNTLDSLAIVSNELGSNLIDAKGNEILEWQKYIQPIGKKQQDYFEPDLNQSFLYVLNSSNQFWLFNGKTRQVLVNADQVWLDHIAYGLYKVTIKKEQKSGSQKAAEYRYGLLKQGEIILEPQEHGFTLFDEHYLIKHTPEGDLLCNEFGKPYNTKTYPKIYGKWINNHLPYSDSGRQGLLDSNGKVDLKSEWEPFFNGKTYLGGYNSNSFIVLKRYNEKSYNALTNGTQLLFDNNFDSCYRLHGWQSLNVFYHLDENRKEKFGVVYATDKKILELQSGEKVKFDNSANLLSIRKKDGIHWYSYDGELMFTSKDEPIRQWQQDGFLYSQFDTFYNIYKADNYELIQRLDTLPVKKNIEGKDYYLGKKSGKLGLYSLDLQNELIPSIYQEFGLGVEQISDSSLKQESYFIKGGYVFLAKDLICGKILPWINNTSNETRLIRGTPNMFLDATGKVEFRSKYPIYFIEGSNNSIIQIGFKAIFPFNSSFDTSIVIDIRNGDTLFSLDRYYQMKLINDSIFVYDEDYFRKRDGSCPCKGYVHIKEIYDSLYLATVNKRKVQLLNKQCDKLLPESVYGIINFSFTEPFYIATSVERRPYNHYGQAYRDYSPNDDATRWKLVRFENNLLVQLYNYQFNSPYPVDKDAQIVKTDSGIGVLGANHSFIVEPHAGKIVEQPGYGYFFDNVYKRPSIDGLLNQEGDTIAKFEKGEVSAIIDSCMLLYDTDEDELYYYMLKGIPKEVNCNISENLLERLSNAFVPHYLQLKPTLSHLDEGRRKQVLVYLITNNFNEVESVNKPEENKEPENLWFPLGLKYHVQYNNQDDKQYRNYHASYNQNELFFKPNTYQVANLLKPIDQSAHTITFQRMEGRIDRESPFQIVNGNISINPQDTMWHNISEPITLLFTDSGLVQSNIFDILHDHPTKIEKLNQIIVDSILSKPDVEVKCTRSGNYVKVVDYFIPKKEGIIFGLRNYRSGKPIEFLVPKSELKDLLRIEL